MDWLIEPATGFEESLLRLPDDEDTKAVVVRLLHHVRRSPLHAPAIAPSTLRVIYARPDPPYPGLRLTYSVEAKAVRLWSIDPEP
jgi:hypothetical protein